MAQTTTTSSRSGGRPTLGRKGKPVASTVPSPPRRRRPALTALAVLLIVGGAALAGFLALRMDSREPVLVLNQQVSTGEQITLEMLSSTNVSGDGLDVIPTDQADGIAGKLYARQTIYPGQLLTTELLRTDPPLASDQAQVGVPLVAGKYPPGLRSGDSVRLLRIGDAQVESGALATGLVLEVTRSKSEGFASEGGTAVATVLVPQSVADQVVAATGSNDLGMALIGRGVSIDDAEIADLSQTGSR